MKPTNTQSFYEVSHAQDCFLLLFNTTPKCFILWKHYEITKPICIWKYDNKFLTGFRTTLNNIKLHKATICYCKEKHTFFSHWYKNIRVFLVNVILFVFTNQCLGMTSAFFIFDSTYNVHFLWSLQISKHLKNVYLFLLCWRTNVVFSIHITPIYLAF